jgi:hypothetical protein
VSSNETRVEREELRSRLSQMSDAELICFGNAMRRSMYSGDKVDSVFVHLFDEALSEWHRRRKERRH